MLGNPDKTHTNHNNTTQPPLCNPTHPDRLRTTCGTTCLNSSPERRRLSGKEPRGSMAQPTTERFRQLNTPIWPRGETSLEANRKSRLGPLAAPTTTLVHPLTGPLPSHTNGNLHGNGHETPRGSTRTTQTNTRRNHTPTNPRSKTVDPEN